MLVSFHLVVAFVIAVDWTCLGWTQLWDWFTEVTARLFALLNSLVESCCPLGALMLCHCSECRTVTFRLLHSGPSGCGPACFVSPALHTLGSGSPLEPESPHWLYAEIPLDSLRCWNLLCALKLVAIRNESCFHCCHLDHAKLPSKLPPSESIQNVVRAKYFICCRFLLFCSFPVRTMWSPHCVLPAWASSFPSHHALNLNCLPIS